MQLAARHACSTGAADSTCLHADVSMCWHMCHDHEQLLLQVPRVTAEAHAALAAGQAVVIGLQSTGEAAADAMQLEPNQTCGFLSTTRELLTRFVAQHFPVRYEPGLNDPAGWRYIITATVHVGQALTQATVS